MTKLLLLIAVGVFHFHSTVAVGSRPNIVVIMADDLGLGDISFHVRSIQHKTPVVETPHSMNLLLSHSGLPTAIQPQPSAHLLAIPL